MNAHLTGLPRESARLAEDYLEALDAALAAADPATRADTVAGIREHIEDALAGLDHPATPQEARAILDELGTPDRIAADTIGETDPPTGGRGRRGWHAPVYAVLALAGMLGGVLTPWLWAALVAAIVLIACSTWWTPAWKTLGVAAPMVGGPLPALASAYGRFDACVTTTSDAGDVSTSCTTTMGGQLAVLALLCLILASTVAVLVVAVHGGPAGRRTAAGSAAAAGATSDRTATGGPDDAGGAASDRRLRLRSLLDAPWAPLAYGALAALGIVGGVFWPFWVFLAAGLGVLYASPRWTPGDRAWGTVGPLVAAAGDFLLSRSNALNPAVSATCVELSTGPVTEAGRPTAGTDGFTVVASDCVVGHRAADLVLGYGLIALVVAGIALTAYVAVRAALRGRPGAGPS